MSQPAPDKEQTERPRVVDRRVVFLGDDKLLTRALQNGHPGAPAELFDRYANHIERVLVNVMGMDQELPDLLHETFAQAFKNAHQLKDGGRLKAWLTRIAVFTARGCLRRRTRRRWLLFFAPEQMPESQACVGSSEEREAVVATYAALDQLPANERLAFALRYIDGMELKEAAAACGVSLVTVKRRIARAQTQFISLAAADPALSDWLTEGSRWDRP